MGGQHQALKKLLLLSMAMSILKNLTKRKDPIHKGNLYRLLPI
jgi:hypothetical protein